MPCSLVITYSGKEAENEYIYRGLPWWPSGLSVHGVQVQSLVGELSSHMPLGQKSKT